MPESPDERANIGTYFHNTREHNTSHRSSNMESARSTHCGYGAQQQHSIHSPSNAPQVPDRAGSDSDSEYEQYATGECLEKYLSLLPTKRDLESIFH